MASHKDILFWIWESPQWGWQYRSERIQPSRISSYVAGNATTRKGAIIKAKAAIRNFDNGFYKGYLGDPPEWFTGFD